MTHNRAIHATPSVSSVHKFQILQGSPHSPPENVSSDAFQVG